MSNLIQLPWHRDPAGYRYVEFKPAGIEISEVGRGSITWDGWSSRLPPPSSVPIRKAGSTDRADAATRWLVDRFPFTVYGSAINELATPAVIASTGDHVVPCAPLEDPALFLILARTAPEPQAVVKFANAYGLLRTDSTWERLHKPEPGLEDWQTWVDAIDRLSRLVDLWRSSSRAGQQEVIDFFNDGANLHSNTTMFPMLTPGSDGGPLLSLRPRDLLTGIYLQFAQAVAGKVSIRACAHCAKPMLIGGTVKLRSDAKYCSPRCRKAAHLQHASRAAE